MFFARADRRPTAAWRLSAGMTLAFAFCAAVAFGVMYKIVADTIQERADAWLRGEAEVLSHVAMNTPQDHLYSRIVEEVAELASHEAPGLADGHDMNPAVFFLRTADGEPPLWVGPGTKDAFVRAITLARLAPGAPQSIRVEGAPTTFRVAASEPEGKSVVYLGLSDRAATGVLDSLMRMFLIAWMGMAALGFFIAYFSARRTLIRVERISETVSRIGVDEFGARLSEAGQADEISRLAQTFNRMLDRIQTSVNQLRTLTDGVAHDLKSPVTWIRGRLEIALSNADNTSWREPVAEAIEGVDRLALLLNTTLDLAEAEAGALRLDRTRIDFSALLVQMLDLYQPALAERRHDLVVEIEAGIEVDGDISLMNRILGNLFDNEVAHLPESRRIAVRLQSEGREAVLTIEDNGPGFPPELRSRAHERFVKGASSTGHGLGLALVNAVVRAHGGGLTIGDRGGGGAHLTVRLPRTGTFFEPPSSVGAVYDRPIPPNGPTPY